MHFKTKQWEYLQGCWHLTSREIQVAKLVCEGHNNEQIAEELHIAYNTVRVHIGHMCNKIGARGKSGLIIAFNDVLQKARIQ